MSKKFLRHPSRQLPFDDDDDSDDESEELGTPQPTANLNLSDDDSDEESEEEERTSNKRKAPSSQGASKKHKASSFLDMEAEASDEDEDEEDLDGEDMDEEAREMIRMQDRRRANVGTFGGRSAADISRDIEIRHKQQNRRVDRSTLLHQTKETAPEVPYTAAVAQQSLVPSVADPHLWMVDCLTGKENELVLQIMNKCIAMARQNRPLGISAVIAAQSKGKLYIESFHEPNVLEAIQGVRGVMPSKMRLVPIADMTTVMTVIPTKKPVQVNEWVRLTRGHYKGDLALVKAVKESGEKCVIQCIPRIDLTLADLSPEEAKIRRKTVRPPQKFFNSQELASLGREGQVTRNRFPGLPGGDYCDYYDREYYLDGYLLKEMKVGVMIKPCGDDDKPTLDELQKFQQNSSNDDGTQDAGSKVAASLIEELSSLQGSSRTSSMKNGGLIVGDVVQVIEGDLVGVLGKLLSIDGTTVKIRPMSKGISDVQDIEFLIGQVRKHISIGAHVKVMDGRYTNETGTVVAISEEDNDAIAIVLTDVTRNEIQVRISQLRESTEVASGQDKLMGYELYDLVRLSGGGSVHETGIIVRVGREDFTVVNNQGLDRVVRPEELRGKINKTSNNAMGLDAKGNQVRCGDTVRVLDGPFKGKSATIKRMSKNQLFLHSQTRAEHAGIFVVRVRSTMLAGSRNQKSNSVESGASPSPYMSPQSQSSSYSGNAARSRKQDDALVGKSVRIQAGQWKGYIGTVSDATPVHVQVELHSRLKKVMVSRERVAVVGDKFGATEVVEPTQQVPTTVPMATPMHVMPGGATPAIHGFGGATPGHDGENADDVWRPGGAVDQQEDDGWGNSTSDGGNNEDNDGGWGSSSNTNAWGDSSSSNLKVEDTGRTAAKNENGTVAVKRETIKTEIAETNEDNGPVPVWFMERVCVQFKSDGKKASIREINQDKTAIVELEDQTTKTVRYSDVTIVPPVEHDTVLVTGGIEVGLEGSLVCVDGTDAILKDADDEFKIIDFVQLVKISTSS